MNPVLQKDVLGMLRLKRTAAAHVTVLAALGLLVLMTWPQEGVIPGSFAFAGVAAPAQDHLVLGLVIGQIVLLVLFVPGMAAVALSGEREANTLEMLYASRLSPTSIILGKVGSAMSFPLMVLLWGLPFAALLNLRGQADSTVLIRAYLILLLSAVLLTLVPLAISSMCRQNATSLVLSYLIVLVLSGGVLVPASIMSSTVTGPLAHVLHYLRSLSPVAAELSLLRPHSAAMDAGLSEMNPSWQIFVPFALTLIAVSFGLLVMRLKVPPSALELASFGAEARKRSMIRRLNTLIDPNRPRKPFGDFNPVFSKERRTHGLASGRWMLRIFYGGLLLSLGLALMAFTGGATAGGEDLLAHVAVVMVLFQVALVGLVVPCLTTPAIAQEVENETFETLRMTRLRAGDVFWGKFLPAFIPAVLPVIALLPAYLTVCYVDGRYVVYIGQLLPVVLLANIFCVSLGLVVSAFMAKTAQATVASYLITGSLFVLPLLAWLAGGRVLNAKVAAWLAMPSPLVMATHTLPAASPEIARLWGVHLAFMATLCIVLLSVARVRLAALIRQG